MRKTMEALPQAGGRIPREDDVSQGSLFFGSPIWTFNWNPPYAAPLRRLARTGCGCKGFELTAWSVDMLAYYTPETIRELKQIADGEGLVLTNFFFNLPFSRAANAAVSTVDLEGYKRGMDVAAEIGTPIVTSMTPYPFQSDVKRLEEHTSELQSQ